MILERHEIEGSIPARFARVAAAYPEAPALPGLSYAELDAAANRLAHVLLERLGESEEPVPALLAPGPDAFVAFLGILKAGKAHAALDPEEPEGPRDAWLASISPRLVIGEGLELEDLEVISPRQEGPENDPGLEIPPDRLASLVFTSGSTGVPRGVERSHRGILHRVHVFQGEQQGLGPGDRVVLTASLTFMASEANTFGALLSGATLLPYSYSRRGLGPLASWLAEEDATHLHLPAGLLRRLLAGRDSLPPCRVVALGGEAITEPDVRAIFGRFPDCVLVHRYSSSETSTMTSTTLRATDPIPKGAVPAGRPVVDKRIRIVDEEGSPLPCGEVGTIMVESPYLSRGYWKGPRFVGSFRTADRGCFDEDGVLHVHGRSDSVVKIRGVRVDLQVVENAALSHPGVTECAALVREGARGDLDLAVAASHPPDVDLRTYLEQHLPAGAVPTRYLRVRALPLTPTGKTDRMELARLLKRSRHGIRRARRAPAIQTLLAIWERAFDQTLGATDNFFELGGTSLTAGEILLEVEHSFGARLDLSVFAEAPSVQSMAALLGTGESLGLLVPITPDSPGPPLFCVHGGGGDVFTLHNLGRHLGDVAAVYGIRASRFYLSVRRTARAYNEALREVQAHGPYRLAGRCYGGIIATEMATQLVEAGESVEYLAILDHGRPPRLPFRDRLRRLLKQLRTRDPRRAMRHFHLLDVYHHTRDYPGTITFFFPTKNLGELRTKQWSAIAGGGLIPIQVPGGHLDLLREPFVTQVASAMVAALAPPRSKGLSG